MLFHRLEQGALRLRPGAVDLVGEQHVREHRPGVKDERFLAALVDADADQVRGHQVGGELGAREPEAERDRDGVRQRRLADPGNVLDQQVAAGEHAGDAVFDLRPLADDDRANLVDEFGQLGGERSAHRPDITRKLRAERPMTTAFYSHPDCRGHDMGARPPRVPGAPRRDRRPPHRLRPRGARSSGARRRWSTIADVGRAHSSGFVGELRDVLEQVDRRPASRARSTPTPSPRPAPGPRCVRAAGAAVAATDAVIDGDVANAFCAVRPPGHHATRDQAMGFCFFNNVARRRAPRARRARPRARRHRRLRRPPRQRHRRHHRRRRARADGEHLPAPALSVQRRRAARRPT